LKPTPNDILLLYMAGHGISLPVAGAGRGVYAYLTQEATTSDPQKLAEDRALQKLVCLTNDELEAIFNRMGAGYRVAILDTCAAGAADLTTHRALPEDQIRALERFKDRSGFHILLGCTAGKVSYESSQYQHGVLTYALLQGMKGPGLRAEEWLDVETLFRHAESAVLPLAQGIGGVQQPRYQKAATGSFDIGRLYRADQAAIVLSEPLPQLVRPRLALPDGTDELELEPLVRKTLQNRLTPIASSTGKTSAPRALYLNADSLLGAFEPRGVYTVSGSQVSVSIKLVRSRKTEQELTIYGTTDRLSELATATSEAIIEAVKSLSSITPDK
jgi:hypothetical protein